MAARSSCRHKRVPSYLADYNIDHAFSAEDASTSMTSGTQPPDTPQAILSEPSHRKWVETEQGAGDASSSMVGCSQPPVISKPPQKRHTRKNTKQISPSTNESEIEPLCKRLKHVSLPISSTTDTPVFSPAFLSSLEKVKKQLELPFTLKDLQVTVLFYIFLLRDVFCLFPTGFGKSILYQIAPFLLQHHPRWKDHSPICLVVTPLNAIMHDQIMKLSRMGISACGLDFTASSVVVCEGQDTGSDTENNTEEDDSEFPEKVFTLVNGSMEDVKNGKFRLVFAHPEALLSNKGKELLDSKVYQENICCVAYDEGHLVQHWKDFRTAFGRLGNITATFNNIAHVCLSATATPSAVAFIEKSLQLRNTIKVMTSPNRPNIAYYKYVRPQTIEDGLMMIIPALAEEMQRRVDKFPLTIFYSDLGPIGSAYKYFKKNLTPEVAYAGTPSPETRRFAQFHAHYPERMKLHIISELCKAEPIVRIVFASCALGMGLDAPGIRRVIHFKAPHSIEAYMQETGRAGRDGQPACAWLFYNGHDIKDDPTTGISSSMRRYCKSTDVCLREILLSPFECDAAEEPPSSPCCGICTCKACK